MPSETVGKTISVAAGVCAVCSLLVSAAAVTLKPFQGANKTLRLEAYLRDHDQGRDDILWPQSYAYADSYTDVPLLERVGHPVAVYPDPQLAAHAQIWDWQIIA